MENLLNNAITYGATESPISVTIRDTQNRIQISVHNFGNELSLDDISKLFEPFHRGYHTQSQGKKGWGLGLTLVQGITEAHRGSVKVSSTPSEGTTFIVELPKDAR